MEGKLVTDCSDLQVLLAQPGHQCGVLNQTIACIWNLSKVVKPFHMY